MPLGIVAGPGCDRVAKESYAESRLGPEGGVIISAGRIFKSLGVDPDGVPSDSPDTLRLALYMRGVAIRQAREQDLNGFVLTSNGDRAALDALAAQAGATRIDVIGLTEAEACRRVAALVPAGQRRDACDEGVRRRWFGRYVAGPNDVVVDPSEGREMLEHDAQDEVGVVEIRESSGGPRLRGIVLQEGRAAQGGRCEVFAPMSSVWPSDGIAILTAHHGKPEVRAIPLRTARGDITIDVPATPAIVDAVRGGRKHMSIEFKSLAEIRTRGGVRELQRAFIDAAALVAAPEYAQSVAEVRSRARGRRWL